MSIDVAASDSPVEFDPFSDVYFNDPYELSRRMRDEAPVFHSERYRFYALSNFGSLLALLAYPVFIEPWLGASASRTLRGITVR